MTQPQTVFPRSGFHLYASTACPYSHRVLAALDLTGLTSEIGISWTATVKREQGWELSPAPDPVFGQRWLSEIYAEARAPAGLRPSVPLLVDAGRRRFLGNESLPMLRWVSTGFGGRRKVAVDLAPVALRARLDRLNLWLHRRVCHAVYRVGFAQDQARHDQEVLALFAALDVVERRLWRQDWLLGRRMTESDLLLFATLCRFERIYAPLFKCLYRPLTAYPALLEYLDRMLAHPVLAARRDLASDMRHYFGSLLHTQEGTRDLNPTRVIPAIAPLPPAVPRNSLFTTGGDTEHSFHSDAAGVGMIAKRHTL